MNWNVLIRQIHRWVSIAFTLGVIANVLAMTQKSYPQWVGLLALVPLIALLITGLYMFVWPYAVAASNRSKGKRLQAPA
jgi:hypothetical protein